MPGAPRSPLRLVAVVMVAACASSVPHPTASTPEYDPRDPLAATRLMQQGQALVTDGQVAAGLAKYRVALSLQPKNPTIHNLIGVAELQQRDAAKAIESFNRALDLAPQYSDARNNRGAAYIQLGQFAMAEADFLGVLTDSTYENRATVYFNLGSLYFTRGNLSAAEENLRKAAVPAGPVEAFFLLGQVEDRLGKADLAENAYRSAMERAPERADIALALGMLLEAHGRKDEARDIFQRVVSLAPGSPEAKQAHAHLE
ncbi:MAG TPA: tetratricopeptide repeat protein [Thermoanaerobaculaceae bacterium]|nr:tetratricopeptide repeat protein [Thermoanaerobaculaceae bacterium]